MPALFAGVFDPQRNHESPLEAVVLPASNVGGGAAGILTPARDQATSARADRRPTPCIVSGRPHLSPLAAELGIEPLPTERVLASAYARWGVGMLGRLRGSFALVLWDAEARRGLVAVDHVGSAPLFFCAAGARLLFASEIRDLLTMLPRRPVPNPTGLVHWLAGGSLPRGATLYEGVRRLEGGHYLLLGDYSWDKRQYWVPTYAPPARVHPSDLAERLRGEISSAVDRAIGDEETVALLLSGGIDSSALAGLASRPAPGREPLRAYSAVFPTFPAMDESSVIEGLTRELGIPSKHMHVRGGSMLAGSLEFLSAWEMPSVSPNIFFGVPLLRLAAVDGTSVFLDGEGGDELFGAAMYLLADRLRTGRLLSGMMLARRLVPGDHPAPWRAFRRLAREYAVKGAVPFWMHGAARRMRGDSHYAPNWFTAESAQTLVETGEKWAWKRASGPRWWASLADVLTAGRERSGSHDFLRRKGALAGLEGAHPFLDDLDLIEFVLRLPPAVSLDPHLDRPLLRDAVRGVIPDAVRLRREKSDFMPLFLECLTGTDRAPILKLLSDPRALVYGFVRRDVVADELLAGPPAWRTGAWAWALWRLVTAECWLRQQEDRSAPAQMLESWSFEEPRYDVTAASAASL